MGSVGWVCAAPRDAAPRVAPGAGAPRLAVPRGDAPLGGSTRGGAAAPRAGGVSTVCALNCELPRKAKTANAKRVLILVGSFPKLQGGSRGVRESARLRNCQNIGSIGICGLRRKVSEIRTSRVSWGGTEYRGARKP